jgi:ketosteroid isomerase-like protein
VTRDDLAVVSRMFACWASDDLEGMLECTDAELRWHAAVDGELYEGHDGVRRFFERGQANGQRIEAPLQRAIEVSPGRILVVGRVRLMRPGRGLADSPGVWAFHVQNGRITMIHAYRSESEAIEALKAARASDPVRAEAASSSSRR